MLMAYLDEFGHVGPYLGTDHPKFMHHPVFGYAGFIIPSDRVRAFTSRFEYKKKRQFRAEIQAENVMAARWEKKGSEIFSTGSYQRYPENVKMIDGLTGFLRTLGGNSFFYGQVKPVGTEKSSGETSLERSSHTLRQAVIQLSRYADQRNQEIMILVDSVTPATRIALARDVASMMFSTHEQSMKRVIDIPVELDSRLYGTTQYADWLCASVTRATHYHFTNEPEFAWAPPVFKRLFVNAAVESRIWIRGNGQGTPIFAGALGHSKRWLDRNLMADLPPAAAADATARVRKRTYGGVSGLESAAP